MTKIQRIKKLIKWLIFMDIGDSEKDLAELLGYSKSSFSQIINEKVPVSDKFVDKLVSLNENINKVWVHTGDGEMLLQSTEGNKPKVKPEPKPLGIPLVSVTCVGGFGNNSFSIAERDVKDYYVIPKFKHKKVDFMIEVEGSSMYPKYNSGDVVACTIIKENSFIQWNKTHVIATKEQGIIIKRLKKSSHEDNLCMISDNKDYDPFEVPREEITGIALVVGVIRLE